ncbi:MAG: alkaline phosphatase D family protein [Burkholderiales bacterium]
MRFSRRVFLTCAGSFAVTLAVPFRQLLARPRFSAYPFTLGVASGYPGPDGVVLWTRLAPEPLAGGGMPRAAVEVDWEIAADEAFRRIVRHGREIATAELAHSVHAEVKGLEPGRWYWYRFHAGAATSPVGRTRTAPAADAVADRLRFAFASCQQYEQGYYVAYRHMAAEDLDLVIHLGDYIYESSWGRNHVRSHGAGEPVTLDEYRNRHALYKSDADLQAAHAAFPWLATWDDHEVQNDYANDRSQHLDPRELFLKRRAAAYHAYYEHMPLPAAMRPRGPDLRLYTRAAFGRLAEFSVLDTRQYRSHQVCPRPGRGGGNTIDDDGCRERLDERLTMLGAAQEKWLHDGLAASRAHWNVIAQQTLMAQADRQPGAERQFWSDGWDGYPKARQRLLQFIAARRIANPLVIGGDVHMAAVADLKTDFDDARAPVVASEFVGTSITSQGPSRQRVETLLAENPHIHFADAAHRGYTVMDLAPQRCIARLRAVASVSNPRSDIRDLAVFTVKNGIPGAQRA